MKDIRSEFDANLAGKVDSIASLFLADTSDELIALRSKTREAEKAFIKSVYEALKAARIN